MSTRPPVIYLAGAIRDNRQADIEWRERVISVVGNRAIILNPLAGKVFDNETNTWTVSGIPSSASLIVKHDFWAVDRSDVVVFNFTALAEKYPNIGTLVEFGRATARSILIYAVVEAGYKGHENSTMYNLHPFIEENCAAVFHSLDDLIVFLARHIDVISGAKPSYKGTLPRPGDSGYVKLPRGF